MTNLPPAKSGKDALEVAIAAAEKAGGILLDYFGSKIQVKHKSKGNLVTEADILSEKFILDFLQNEYPDFSILSEESNSSASLTDCAWIVDPLDGTNNYTFGIPFFLCQYCFDQGWGYSAWCYLRPGERRAVSCPERARGLPRWFADSDFRGEFTSGFSGRT